jgi:CheY-like chemotaxis protein
MDHEPSGHRVRLLGELQVFDQAGALLTVPADRVMQRLLVALALRAGRPRGTEELVSIVWTGTDAFNRGAQSLETPVSRLRNKFGLPIPNRRGENYYRLDLGRTQVDALDFIDTVRADRLGYEEIARLLALWRNDPRYVYANLPSTEWNPLLRAVDQLAEHVVQLSPTEQRKLAPALDRFKEILPDRTAALEAVTVVPVPRQRRLLIVENQESVARMLAAILSDYHTTIATGLDDAMEILSASLAELDGALIDLHLTENQDSAGLELLSFIRDRRPDLPRMLITASPPPGSQLQMRRTYGIVDILIKGANGYSANGVRDVVGLMFDESTEAARKRAGAAFESHASRLQRGLNRNVIAARRGIRSGDNTAYDRLNHWSDRLEAFERETEDIRQALATAPVAELDRHITTFVERWPATGELTGGEV